MTVFEDGAFKEVMKLKLEWALIHLTGVRVTRRNGIHRDTRNAHIEERPREDTVRRKPSTSQGERSQGKPILPTP